MNWKTLLNLILFVTAVLSISPSVNSQETFQNPTEVKLSVNRRDYRRNGMGGNFGIENFFPIGWSKDGKFAYYLEPVDEACGCYFGKLVIVDLKNDAVLWQFDYSSEDDEDRDAKKPKSLAALWTANRKLFSAKLNENNIEPQRVAHVLPFPISYQTDRLTPALSIERKRMSEEERIYGNITRARVQLASRRNGSKTILDQKYSETKPLYVGMLGYLKSPHEPRIAIILVEIYRGYEGPPHVGELRVVGASLEKNFK